MKRNKISVLLCGAIALLGMSACSDDMNEGGTDNNAGQSFVYKLNVEGTNGSEDTRALTLDGENHIHTSWKPGDKMFVYNCSDNNQSTEAQYSTVATQNDGGLTASFTGAIKSKNAMQESDVLGFFYPGAAIEQQDNVVAGEFAREKIKNQSGKTSVVEYYKSSEAIKNQVLLNLSQQDGTLETIDKKYDYCWGKTSPTTISGDATNGYTCNAKVDLQRKVAFWGLKFEGEGVGSITNIKQIHINGLKSNDVLNLKDGTLIGTDQNKDFSIDISNNGNPIQLTNGYIWVALLPGDANRVTITLKTTDGKLYSKTVNKIFNENTTYRSKITNIKEVTAEPYVEVCGIKWATGNFIRYVDPNNPSNVYWGIAPAQWWISHYADDPKTENEIKYKGQMRPILHDSIGSQHWYVGTDIINENDSENGGHGAWGITVNDLDLFTWGSIRDVLDFKLVANFLENAGLANLGVPKNERGNLSKKWWELTNRPVASVTTDPTKANFGDIVWRYTYDATHNQHYRYPTQEEMKSLLSANTAVPAYCYTDKGNKIYGAYFSDLQSPSGQQIKGFPTGRNSIWKYENVTGLVLANKGLFLPITGRRAAQWEAVQYRFVDRGSTFFGFYSSSRETAWSTMTGLAFGSNEWVYGAPQKQQGLPIRPVFDSGDENAPLDACKFAPFHNILAQDGTRKY